MRNFLNLIARLLLGLLSAILLAGSAGILLVLAVGIFETDTPLPQTLQVSGMGLGVALLFGALYFKLRQLRQRLATESQSGLNTLPTSTGAAFGRRALGGGLSLLQTGLFALTIMMAVVTCTYISEWKTYGIAPPLFTGVLALFALAGWLKARRALQQLRETQSALALEAELSGIDSGNSSSRSPDYSLRLSLLGMLEITLLIAGLVLGLLSTYFFKTRHDLGPAVIIATLSVLCLAGLYRTRGRSRALREMQASHEA